jgi:hypothetical protein
MHNHQGDSL